jgi:D-glycero-alpha-D-manno-heptose-7-phosphate kinase
MIITRTPYRIPLAGGGTDLDFYYKKRGGSLISATFNQYVFTILLRRQIDNKVLIQTTDTQFTRSTKQIKHPILREILKLKISFRLELFRPYLPEPVLGHQVL